MERLLWICLAGALGTCARYLIGLWASGRLGNTLPYGTFVVNVAGCFLIAVVMQTAMSMQPFPTNLKLALTTGFLGGFTTYSSFNHETTQLIEGGAAGTAFLYFAATTAFCFGAGWLGLTTARWLLGA